MMHEHMNRSTTMHMFAQLQQSTSTYSLHAYTNNSTTIACKTTHQQHICT